MKSLSHLFVWMGIVGLASLGCERHDFEDTKVLHMEHGGGHGDHHAEGDGAHGHGEEGHDEAHGDEHESHGEKANEKAGDEKGKKKSEDAEPRDLGL